MEGIKELSTEVIEKMIKDAEYDVAYFQKKLTESKLKLNIIIKGIEHHKE